MTQFTGKKPSLKAQLAERDSTIIALNNDITTLSQMLEQEQMKIRVPKNISVSQYNSLIDWLIQNKPEPDFPKEVPGKIEEPAPQDVESDSKVS